MFSSGVLIEQRDLSLRRYDVTSGGVDVARPLPFMATGSRAEASVYALRRRVISLTKQQFPALPEGTLNRFLFQWTTSA